MSTHCTLPLTLSSEQPNMLPEGFTMHTPSAGGRALDYVLAQEKAAKQSLNTIVFTAAVLLSPLWSMSQIPSVAINPILRIGAYAACISCLTALVIGCILRLRLKFIKQRQAEDPLNMKARPTRKTIMSVSVVPLALLFSTIALFVFVLFGFTWDAGMEIPEDPADIRLTPDEQLLLALFGMAAFVSTCSTTVASFVPTRDECENEVTEKEDIY